MREKSRNARSQPFPFGSLSVARFLAIQRAVVSRRPNWLLELCRLSRRGGSFVRGLLLAYTQLLLRI